MSITGGFGISMDLERGTARRWVLGRDGVKRWADNGAPCDADCEIERIARDLEVCANAWEPGARLVGNVTAKEIRDLCHFVREMGRMISIDELRPLVADLRTNSALRQSGVDEIINHRKAVIRLRELTQEPGNDQ